MITYGEAMRRALELLERAEGRVGYSLDEGEQIAMAKMSEGYVTLAHEVREASHGLSMREVDELWK